jgi:hypothetical protein
MLCGAAVFVLACPLHGSFLLSKVLTSRFGRTAIPLCRRILPERDIALSGICIHCFFYLFFFLNGHLLERERWK